MLSFMREQGPAGPSDRSAAGTGSPDEAGAQEFLTVATNTRNLRRSTIIVVGLIAIGLACLWLMIRRTQPQAASAGQLPEDETKIEAAISRLTGVSSEVVDGMDEIVQKFYEFSDVYQVKVGELVKNPFQVEGFVKALKDEAIVADDPAVRAQLMMRQRAGTLRLLSIMRSEAGDCCMINDQILRVRDKIEEFTVAQIGSHSVELVWAPGGTPGQGESGTEDLKIVLKLSE